MNTMPQALDDRPITRAGFSVSGPRPAASRPSRRRADAHLKLVVDQMATAPASLPTPPYGLNGRRHLARVPERQASAGATPAQDPAARADNPGMASPWPRRHLEPLAFALVLLVSVAALAVATRAG